MSLLEKAFEPFVIQDRTTSDDGYGGIEVSWKDGATIQGAMVYDSSLQAKIAQSMGVTAVYTFTVKKSVTLNYHSVLKRKKDGKIFRITDNSDDKTTPDAASLNMRQYSAEEWELTNNG